VPVGKGFAKGDQVHLLDPGDPGDRCAQPRDQWPKRCLLALVQGSGANGMPTDLTR
jgi:hypothetical protein